MQDLDFFFFSVKFYAIQDFHLAKEEGIDLCENVFKEKKKVCSDVQCNFVNPDDYNRETSTSSPDPR